MISPNFFATAADLFDPADHLICQRVQAVQLLDLDADVFEPGR
jgi:hypothetical protein